MSPTWGVSSSVSRRMGEEKDVSGRVHGHGEEEGVPFLAEGWGQSFNYVCLAFEKSQSLSCSLFPPFLFLIFLLSHSSGFFSLYFFLCFKFLKFVYHHHYHTIIITIIIISATMKPARIYDLSYFLQPPWGEIPLGPLKGILGLGQMKQLAQGYQAEK